MSEPPAPPGSKTRPTSCLRPASQPAAALKFPPVLFIGRSNAPAHLLPARGQRRQRCKRQHQAALHVHAARAGGAALASVLRPGRRHAGHALCQSGRSAGGVDRCQRARPPAHPLGHAPLRARLLCAPGGPAGRSVQGMSRVVAPRPRNLRATCARCLCRPGRKPRPVGMATHAASSSTSLLLPRCDGSAHSPFCLSERHAPPPLGARPDAVHLRTPRPPGQS